MNNTDKLKPCPFCGSLDLTYFGASIGTAHKVQCLECYAVVASTTQEAATVWNTRAYESEIAELTKQRDEFEAALRVARMKSTDEMIVKLIDDALSTQEANK